ncbi:MAG: hypothetical protein AUI42_00995 [Actinobacteria bacterium 13_1_40CM_2_65_8]|nr:MAG: hypothetical protein AUH40_04160 [Chloroflexi bacterium 13_1_40CM_65_17]OLD50939.1 MAG: hypothetical protein AUI42_00995 [Actinobacteria bacterium 13_1_40CM_2_65_8]
MQSQDYTGAKWGLAQRSRRATSAELDQLFDDGIILRTHVLRPTWHFVLPDDVRWLLDLTGPKIRRGLAARYRELELDDKTFERAHKAFIVALAGGRHLTRAELGEALRKARISTEGQRLPHLLMHAELDGLIVSGPRRGKLFTYALLEERAPKSRAVERSEAIVELSARYFQSHGPAQLQDFAWWSGLTMADARAGARLAGAALGHETIEGKEYWFDAKAGRVPDAAGVAHLLPNFDEYTVAYRDRAEMVHADDALAGILSNVVTIGGKVRGMWRRTPAGSGVRLEVRAMDQYTPAERASVEDAARRFGRFLERPTEVTWPSFV